jgi:anaerobic magnesium-protoporphyrin IX monomethyl ester cyclase
MKVSLLTLEDGLANPGFRKFAAYAKRLHANTDVYFVVTGNYRSFKDLMIPRIAGNALHPDDVELIASEIAQADIVGFSSMTQYAEATIALIRAVRRHNPKTYIVWGGIHPIIEPTDAILHADAICTGEGEFAFAQFLTAFKEHRPYFDTPSFWFNTPDGVKKNRNLPLMTPAEMDTLPIPAYMEGEHIFRSRRGFVPITTEDYVYYNGLSYQTIWSIGCPFKCTFCGNTSFIEYDKNYRKIRHSAPATMIAELKDVVRKHPHISTICFHDDSFMALPIAAIDEFCRLYSREIGLPFVVLGVIPNYVKEDKIRLLINAGMNRVRMGIQSGSEAILAFYERPTPIPRVREAAAILAKFRGSMLQPTFDIILDNPLEKVEDTCATLDLIHGLPRPFTLNIFALRVIPNTRMAKLMEQRGIAMDSIRKPYTWPRPTLANILVPTMVAFNLPKAVFEYLRKRSSPSHVSQAHYPTLMFLARFCYLAKTAVHHLSSLDLTVISGRSAVLFYKLGLARLWQKFTLPIYAARRRRVERPVLAIRHSVPAEYTAASQPRSRPPITSIKAQKTPGIAAAVVTVSNRAEVVSGRPVG